MIDIRNSVPIIHLTYFQHHSNIFKGIEQLIMKKLIIILTLICISSLGLSSGLFGQENKTQKPIKVSMLELVTNPELYAMELVQTSGYMDLGYTESVIYGSEYTASKKSHEDGIWLRGIRLKERSKYNGKYCEIEAVFNPYYKGHKDAWVGTLQDIVYIEVIGD